MNANIFSCTMPPLLVLETQIIHPEVLQSLCINPCVHWDPFFWQTGACGRGQVRACGDICARAHPSARALRQHGSRFDTSTSLKLPTMKKKIGKKLFTRRCPPKEDGRTSMSVHPRPKPMSKPPCPSS